MEQQKQKPMRLSSASATQYWWYKNEFWATSEKLTSDEVKTLVIDQQLRKEQKIARAKARVAVSQGGTEPLPAGRAVSQQVKLAVWQRDGGRCVQCGSNQDLEFDHIIPYSLGGSNTERNIQLLCEKCNLEKGAGF